MSSMRLLFRSLLILMVTTGFAFAQVAPRAEATLGIGDVLKITVYQNPDLSVDARVSETGQINFPLIGTVAVGGLTVSAAEQKIQKMLRDGGFVLKPQVTIQTVSIKSSQISILGQVAKPGRFPIEIVGRAELDVVVENGDIIYVDRAPTFYMYGEVQHPGQMRLERNMTLLQAMAQAGGLTPRGTDRGIRVHRKDATGEVKISELKMNDRVERDDVIYVRESIF